MLLGFHALWLAPYGGRYRNAAVTIDRAHHAAHLWVDRFAVPCSATRSRSTTSCGCCRKLHEVMPVLHARFAGATMAQKYGGLMGDTSEPFVLGGNPLLAVHAKAARQRWMRGSHADGLVERGARPDAARARAAIVSEYVDDDHDHDRDHDDDDDDDE